jgi:hypothetical protein
MDSQDAGRFPTLHVVADSIPRAHFRAMKAVWEQGLEVRTEYDRMDSKGKFIDPPSRDARVLIEVTDPFAQPRYPPVSFCEIGTYIAEVMGAKDHMVVPMAKLNEGISGHLSATEWPYTYHQRLFAHPDVAGEVVDQIALALDRVAETPHTRRAVASTAVPNVDPFLKEDVPCLREMQFRCPKDRCGRLFLNLNTTWRSRDLYKAWADNVIAITFLQQVLARKLVGLTHNIVRIGSYADYSTSLHIYGQDFGMVGGDAERGLRSFFDNFDEDEYVRRSLVSKDAAEMLVLPQLRGLLTDSQIEQWHFPPESIGLIAELIGKIESEEFIA